MNTYIILSLAKTKKALNSNSSSGFTMLEMITVFLLIGLLSAIAAPGWLGFVNTRSLNAAQSEVYQAIRQAQSQAKKQKLTWQVSFREQNSIVQWAVHPASVTPANANWNNLDTKVKLDTVETNLPTSSGISKTQFDYMGSVSSQGTITLASKGGGKAKRCVIISTSLGAMRTAKEKPVANSSGKYCY